jgi:hypothetical protein
MEGVEAVGIEIGLAGHLTLENCFAGATAMLMALERYPFAEFSILLGGYDDDPREIWDIPEAKKYFQDFMSAMDALCCPPLKEWRLDDASWGVLAMCAGHGEIVGRDPVTGTYKIELRPQDPKE